MQLSTVYFSRILLLYTFLLKKKNYPLSTHLPHLHMFHVILRYTPAYVTHRHMRLTGIWDTLAYGTYQQVLYHQHSRHQHYIINIINNR